MSLCSDVMSIFQLTISWKGLKQSIQVSETKIAYVLNFKDKYRCSGYLLYIVHEEIFTYRNTWSKSIRNSSGSNFMCSCNPNLLYKLRIPIVDHRMSHNNGLILSVYLLNTEQKHSYSKKLKAMHFL